MTHISNKQKTSSWKKNFIVSKYSLSSFKTLGNFFPFFQFLKDLLSSNQQFLYAITLSSASAAATESSQSWIVETADSKRISLIFALSALPTG